MTEFNFATDHKCDFWGNLFGAYARDPSASALSDLKLHLLP
jgi:hypothetical protein